MLVAWLVLSSFQCAQFKKYVELFTHSPVKRETFYNDVKLSSPNMTLEEDNILQQHNKISLFLEDILLARNDTFVLFCDWSTVTKSLVKFTSSRNIPLVTVNNISNKFNYRQLEVDADGDVTYLLYLNDVKTPEMDVISHIRNLGGKGPVLCLSDITDEFIKVLKSGEFFKVFAAVHYGGDIKLYEKCCYCKNSKNSTVEINSWSVEFGFNNELIFTFLHFS